MRLAGESKLARRDQRRGLSPRVVGALATAALTGELTCGLKPGLVSLRDSGAHEDMDAHTLIASIDAIGPYFERFAAGGAAGRSFLDVLRHIGLGAEHAMFAATGGVNTHRGAIFTLGVLCAAIARIASSQPAPSAEGIRETLVSWWGDELKTHARRLRSEAGAAARKGAQARRRYGVGGAPTQAALGFPAVFESALPALRGARALGLPEEAARVQALFELMARLDDTNVLHRVGRRGANQVREHAKRFLTQGGCARDNWKRHAAWLHDLFSQQGASPGGCADLLAATLLVDAATSPGGFTRLLR